MELIFPTMEHKQDALDYRQEHTDYNESRIHGSAGFIHAESYDKWLEFITLAQTEVPPEFVIGTTYFAVVDGRIIGTISIRHYLNESLIKHGGHIGYGVRPTERRKGYGTKMLALALEKCRDFGIEKALVTCDKYNIGSAKTVINNAGVFENEITEDNGNILQRYWITV